jgi:hypothetical protein
MIRLTTEGNRSLTQMAIDDIEKGEIPRYLYKYRAPNEFTTRIIKNNALFYSTPLSFNDPFDCQITLNTENTLKEITAFLRQNSPDLKSSAIKSQALYWHKNPRLFHKHINEGAREAFNDNGVCCFTTDPKNILMWSHYADSHRGICMKFDLLADPLAFFAAYKVNYEEEYPVLNHVRNKRGESVTKLLITKAIQWAYEEEYRILKMGEPGNHSFAPSALVEIIFGLRCPTPFVSDIMKLTDNSRMGHVTFAKAQTLPNRFALEIRKIPRR